MAEQLTPLSVVHEMEALTEKLAATVQRYRNAEKDMVTKRHAADVAEARAYVRAEGPVEERKRLALIATDSQEGEAVVAEAYVRVLKRELALIEQQIDVARSKGATVRAEFRTLDYSSAP